MKNRLKVILAEKNLTAKKLSEITNISQSTISKFLKGKSEMKISTLLKICDALSIGIEQMFNKWLFNLNISNSDK